MIAIVSLNVVKASTYTEYINETTYYETTGNKDNTKVKEISKIEYVSKKVMKEESKVEEYQEDENLDTEFLNYQSSRLIDLGDGGDGGGTTVTHITATPNGNYDNEKQYTKKTEMECFDPDLITCYAEAQYYNQGNLTKLNLKATVSPELEYIDVVAKLTWFESPTQSEEDYFAIFYSEKYYAVDTSLYGKTSFEYMYRVDWIENNESMNHLDSEYFYESVRYMDQSTPFDFPNAGSNNGILWTFKPFINTSYKYDNSRHLIHEHEGCPEDGENHSETAMMSDIVYTTEVRLKTKDSKANSEQGIIIIETTYQHKYKDFDISRVGATLVFKALFNPIYGINAIEASIYETVDSERRTTIEIDMED